MNYKRTAGILLHPTSLPSPYGIGDFGPDAFNWIDFLSETGCSLWQVLPLGPTGYGDSPYQCFSAFAGNPYLINPTLLFEEGFLSKEDISEHPNFPLDTVDYGLVISWKLNILEKAFINFEKKHSAKLKSSFDKFIHENAVWLDDYALFMTIKDAQAGKAWYQWNNTFRFREPLALENFKNNHLVDILKHKFSQFLFFKQWNSLHNYARKKEIQIIGDIPIFVAYDSADAWAHPEYFYFDEKRRPKVVAGVPPDYFSKTGQLWGNPLYNWEYHKQTGYSWWIQRVKSTLDLVDIVRLDHFRGFAAYWAVPYGKPTAEKGKWVPGPGVDLFIAIEKSLGELPIIAEDLGVITSDVISLRDRFGFPGMKILQFSFNDNPSYQGLPHNYFQNCVVYSGTHDNNTTLGWYQTATEIERDFCRRYLARSGDDISWDMIRAAWSSVGIMALAPMQDFLSLGSEARMNFPSVPSGNWTWRMRDDVFKDILIERIRETNYLYGRLNS